MKYLLATLLAVSWMITPVLAQEADRTDTTFKLGKNWFMELDSDDNPYPDYLADREIPSTSSGHIGRICPGL